MKELAERYITNYDKSKYNDFNYFSSYYKNSKLIYPWLDKEALRWHVRKHLKKKKDKLQKVEQKTLSNENKCQVSRDNRFIIDNIYCFSFCCLGADARSF